MGRVAEEHERLSQIEREELKRSKSERTLYDAVRDILIENGLDCDVDSVTSKLLCTYGNDAIRYARDMIA